MIIKTIDIKYYSSSHLTCIKDNEFHKKSLPYLSVVQALEGSYGIGINTPIEQLTGTMGAFIAPKGEMQYITHYIDPKTGKMKAHWIFLEVIINGIFHLDDLFSFPVLLPEQYNQEVCDIIAKVESNSNICDNLSDIYKLIKILIETGIDKNQTDKEINQICYYITQHYAEKITPPQLAKQFSLSVSTLFRKFKKFLGLSPSNYINFVRLTQATHLLETTNHKIGEVCTAVGIEDIFYFSRLFKLKYGISPLNYRKQNRNISTTEYH